MSRTTFAEKRKEIEADPKRSARVAQHKRNLELAIHLVELREKAGLTQRELAERLGVDQSRISRLERAEDLQLSTLAGYVQAVGGDLQVRATLPDKSTVELV